MTAHDQPPPQGSRASRRIVRGFAAVSGGSFGVMAIQLGYAVLTSRLLDPTDFGAYAVALSGAGLVATIAGPSIGQSAARANDRISTDRALLSLALMVGPSATALVIILSTVWSDLLVGARSRGTHPVSRVGVDPYGPCNAMERHSPASRAYPLCRCKIRDGPAHWDGRRSCLRIRCRPSLDPLRRKCRRLGRDCNDAREGCQSGEAETGPTARQGTSRYPLLHQVGVAGSSPTGLSDPGALGRGSICGRGLTRSIQPRDHLGHIASGHPPKVSLIHAVP